MYNKGNHKNEKTGISTVAQQDPQCLCSTGMQVPFLAWHSGLRIWCCHSCGISHNCSSDLIPGPGTSYAAGWPKKKGGEQSTEWEKIVANNATNEGLISKICKQLNNKKPTQLKNGQKTWTFLQRQHTYVGT